MKEQRGRSINAYSFGISLPRDTVKKIDSIRSDVCRSKFILRLIEKGLLQSGVQVGAQSQTAAVDIVDVTRSAPHKERTS
jgi:hypothetical protein